MESSLKEKIINLRKEGKSFNQIKKELNCSKGYISDVCKNHGISDIGLKNRQLSLIEIEELKKYYETHTKEETAIKFNVSTTTVNKYKVNKRKILNDSEKRENNYKNVKSFRKRIKEKAVEYKGGSCIICSYNKCIKALDFHHLDQSEKEFRISQNCNKAWDKVKIKLDKCILVCSNCHREIHDNLIDLNRFITN
jgi:DNA-binding CsgD family transcriptional regulator